MRKLLRRAFPKTRWLRDERGQNIVLGALLLLFVAAAVMLTFSIGYRTREKLKLQALADSGAYSIAVAEARLFNHFAWSNRVHAAHDVAILSVHSHASYITFQEALFKAAKDALNIVKWEMYGWCIPCIKGVCCQSCKNASKFGKAANEYWSSNYWSGQWLHDKWHDSDTYDKALMGANKLHYLAIKALYVEQQANLRRLAVSSGVPALLKTMPQKAAQVVDPDIKSGVGAAAASARNLHNAISWGPSEDWKEITSATRHNSWIYNRKFKAGGAWLMTFGKASMKLMPCFHVPYPTDTGNAKTTKNSSSWSQLSNNIHKSGDDDNGWGRAEVYGAEDHGAVNMFGMCDCPGYGRKSAKGGLQSGPEDQNWGRHFYFHATSESRKSEPDVHNLGGCNGPAGNEDPDGGGDCGVYYRHPRYRWGSEDYEENKVWNHPHPVVVLTKDTGKMINKATGEKYAFEFDVDVEIPVPIHFQTLGNKGDTDAGNKMAAIAGALVYYHKPNGDSGSDNWKEPPSFWNPYWRAKLHPLKGPGSGLDSRGVVLGIDHRPSSVPANPFIAY